MKITLDKIASVTKNAKLKNPVSITKKIPAEEGAVIIAEVLFEKKVYNQLELVSGRMSTLQKGDLIAVALGNRRALKGFVGNVPKSIKVGDVIHLLNLGGVAGICTSENFKEVGHALKIKVLGAATKKGKVVNIKDFQIFKKATKITSKIPIIIISGTCMNVGKTSTACEIIKYATRSGLNISAAKLAGIAAMRDTENMKDHGASHAVSIIDGGLTSTIKNKDAVDLTKGAINYLSKKNPDFIVIEFGDGIFGEYGVSEILQNKEIQKNIAVHIGNAHDPMGASQLVHTCKELSCPVHIISGPVTDNSIGSTFIKNNLNLPAINALYQGEKLFRFVSNKLKKH